MSIGKIIKKLRRDKDMTQEKLAEYLNISTQAVSRWETDLAMPDITLLPALANIFNVTTDYLLGVDITKKKERITEYGNAANEANTKGDVETIISIWRNALHEFPNDCGVMLALAGALHMYGGDDKEKKNRYFNESLLLSEKVHNDSTNDNERNLAVLMLVQLYTYKGEYEMAKKFAENMPNMHLCSNELLSGVLKGDELLINQRENFDLHFLFMRENLEKIANNDIYTISEKLELYLMYDKMYDLVFKDDLDEMKKIYGWYIQIAEYYGSLGDVENTFKYIEKAKENAIACDTNPPYKYKYTMKSLLFKGMARELNFSKNYTFNESMNILKIFDKHKEFDFIRNEQRFKDIVAELEQYAKYE